MRTKFAQELDALTEELILMSRTAHEAVERATDAVTRADLTIAYEVFACDEQLKIRHASCQQRSLLLLALQAPVARDLRHVVTGSQIADNLSHMGSLTSQVAHYVYRHHPGQVVPAKSVSLLETMGKHCMALAGSAARAIATRDAAPNNTDTVSATHQELLTAVTDGDWPHGTSVAVDLALIGNCYVRYADHAVRISQLIRFFDTGIPAPPEAL